MITKELKNLRVGCRAIVSGYSGDYGTLHKARDGRWYIFSNNYNMDGSKPEDEWESVKGDNIFSFWIADSTRIETSYDVELLYDIDRIEKITSKAESKPSFKAKVGDILHILSEEDIKKFNSMDRLQAGGDYFGYHLEVTTLSGDNAVVGNIFNKYGDLVISGWGVWLKDFYEYHGINPPSYATPYLVVRKEFDGSTTRRVETKKSVIPGHTIDSSGSMSFGSSSTATGDYSIGTKAYVDSHSSSDGYVSKDSIKHEGSRCTLPHTSDWQIAGDSVPRRRATDMLLILGL